MSVNQRFADIINKQYSGNKRAFSITIGVSPTVVENVVGKRQGNPSFEVIQKVLCANANINPDWLINGIGEMFRQVNNEGLPPVGEKTSGDPPECARCKDKDAVIAAQRAQIESQTELLDLLKQARPSTNDGQKRKTA